MKALVLAAALAAGPTNMSAPDSATLVVKVEHVSPKGGDISLALFDATNYDDDDHPTLDRTEPAEPSGTSIVIEGLKPGVYAVKMMQDINRNGHFDTSWIGFPLEPYGFSNNARPGFSEPSFEKAKFMIAPGTNVITIRLSDTDGISVPSQLTARRAR